MERHYLYRHIRLDTNEVFYVGIGTKNKRDLKNYTYSRAFSKGSRSNFWKSVINKTKYEVDILLESTDYDWVKGKEVEFIKLYGRKDLELGTLCNLTNGGDGTLGYVITEKYRESLKNGRIKAFNNGYRMRGKPLFQYCGETGKFIKEWEHTIDAANHIVVTKGLLGKVSKGNNNNYCKGYFWFSEYKGIIINNYKGSTRRYNSTIIMIDKYSNNEVEKFESINMAFKFLNKPHCGLIRRAIKNNSVAYNYKWKENE